MNEVARPGITIDDELATPALVARDLHKNYIGGDGTPLRVLTGTDLTIMSGDTVAIIGESGSGKSTLLQLLGGLDVPTSGEIELDGRSLAELTDDELSLVRNEHIGFIFQFHHLLAEFSAIENVMMPQLIAGRGEGEARERARELLSDVGLGARLDHRPGALSGGEQQRVAVARALANEPVILLADEPSGNLDPGTSESLHEMLFAVSARHGSAMALVTHNMGLAARAGRVLELKNGKLVPATAQTLTDGAPEADDRDGDWFGGALDAVR